MSLFNLIVKFKRRFIRETFIFIETQAQLLTPGAPTFVSSEFRSIRLVWNATNRSDKSSVKYIVHVDPQWTNQSANEIFPYVKTYYVVSKSAFPLLIFIISNNFLGLVSRTIFVIFITYCIDIFKELKKVYN